MNADRLRLGLIDLMLESLADEEDPRAPAAIERLQAQRAIVAGRLAEQVSGECIQEDAPIDAGVVVKLNTLRLHGKTQMGGNHGRG